MPPAPPTAAGPLANAREITRARHDLAQHLSTGRSTHLRLGSKRIDEMLGREFLELEMLRQLLGEVIVLGYG